MGMSTEQVVGKLRKHAYGVLLWRKDQDTGSYSVFLVRENGPRYWGSGRQKIWGLPKGGGEVGESAFESASREFAEEVGMPLPDIKYKKMMDHHRPKVRQMITVFTGNASKVDVAYVSSNHRTCEWPRKSGQVVTYPEIEDAQWLPLDIAVRIVLPGQRRILRKFAKKKKVQL